MTNAYIHPDGSIKDCRTNFDDIVNGTVTVTVRARGEACGAGQEVD